MKKNDPLKKYNVYAGMLMKLIASVNTEKQAWKIVGNLSLFEIFEVRDEMGEIRAEFIPY